MRDLPELVAGYAAAGLKVDLDADADLAAVPGDAGLAAYRIAQESLTNAAKHAPGSAASVQVRATPAELRLTVTNDILARGAAAPAGIRARDRGHDPAGRAGRWHVLGRTGRRAVAGRGDIAGGGER